MWGDAGVGPAVLGMSCAGYGRRPVRAATWWRRRVVLALVPGCVNRSHRYTSTERRAGGQVTLVHLGYLYRPRRCRTDARHLSARLS